MSTVEIILWSLFLLAALVTLGIMLFGAYRIVRQRLSGDYRASQEAKILVEQGRSYLEQGDFDQAVLIYEQAMALDPNNAQAHSMCGLARAWQGDHRAAIADYNRALDLDPCQAATYMERGWAYQRLGDMEMALTDLDRAVTLNPDDPIIRLSRLKLHQALGNIETALADLEHVMETSPELAEKESTKTLLAELQEFCDQ